MNPRELTVKILIGLPASGKTTYSLDFVRKNPDWVHISRDDYRFMLQNRNKLDEKLERMVTEMQHHAVLMALQYKQNVILDNCHVKASHINRVCELVKYKAKVEFILFDVPMNKCIERDKNRTRPVGETTIREMNDALKILKDCFDFQNRPCLPVHMGRFIPKAHVNGKKTCVIFDIDGTIAHMGKRGPFDWEKVHLDDINEIVVEQITFHRNLGREIILVSGRDETCRQDTIDWLNLYDIQFDQLYMRPKEDWRKDTVIKRELYTNFIEPFYNVVCVYDDRLQVLKMWHKLGLFTFNVNQGNVIF
jgi:predicted kinase